MNDTKTSVRLAAEFQPRSWEDWWAAARLALKEGDLRDFTSTTYDGIAIERLAWRRDERVPAIAGEWPAGGARIAPLIAEPTLERAKAAMADEIAGGADALVLQFARPGLPGLALDGADDVRAIIEAVDLSAVGLRLRGGLALREIADGDPWDILPERRSAPDCALGFDPFSERASGALDGSALEQSLAWAAASHRSAPASVFTASGLAAHEAGASEAQELAAMLAAAVAYLRSLEACGVAIGDAASAIVLELAADADLVLSIAKLRASRLIWARVLEASGAAGAPGRLCVQTSARMMARRDVRTNMVRTTCAAFAALAVGADEITVLPFTHSIGYPDSLARRIARNTGIILRVEGFLGAVADPAAGSFHIEELTGALAERAWDLFREIETEGGLAAALATGSLARRIAEVQTARAVDIAEGRQELVGVTIHLDELEKQPDPEPWQVPPPIYDAGDPLRPLGLAESGQ